MKFYEYVQLRESQLDEGRVGLLGGLALGAASMFGGQSQAQEPSVHHFSGSTLTNPITSHKQLNDDERFIKSWTMYKEQIIRAVKRDPHVKDFLIEIIEEHHQGKMEAVVEIEATIEAPSKEEAKQMLISLIMRETGKMNMQGSAIRGLKKIFVDKNENALYAKIIREFSNAVHRVKIKITSNDATIEP